MLKFFYTRKHTRKKFVDDLFTQVARAWMRWEEIHGAVIVQEPLPYPPGQVPGCSPLHWEAPMETQDAGLTLNTATGSVQGWGQPSP